MEDQGRQCRVTGSNGVLRTKAAIVVSAEYRSETDGCTGRFPFQSTDVGSQALKQIGSVIKNPEIQVLVPVLLEALADPSNKAQGCLQALLNTEFVHVIDPPSLALIMPTLKRTLEIRSTDTKKMAAQIIGNMYSLTDKKDLAPYLPDVLPGLKQSLVDPVPEVMYRF